MNTKKRKTNVYFCIVRAYRTSASRVTKHGVIRSTRQAGIDDVTNGLLSNIFESFHRKTHNLGIKTFKVWSESESRGFNSEAYHISCDLGGFSPEFCMRGTCMNGDTSSLLCLRVCLVVVLIHSDWCTLKNWLNMRSMYEQFHNSRGAPKWDHFFHKFASTVVLQ